MLFVLLCGSPCAVQASSLFGRVIEVNSGDVITVFNLNRPVRVKLLGVDAPEMSQVFGDLAKKHLSDLVYDQSVIVEYSGIAADGSLTGRVLLNNADIGAQMIRDGAAWFDPNNYSCLSQTDRDVYQQSEQAARSERRGLWQAENPTAPWEFVKAKALRKNPSLNRTMTVAQKRGEPRSELTNLSLMMAKVNAVAPSQPAQAAVNDGFDWARSATRKKWRLLQPAGENFSVLVPEEGKEETRSVPNGDRMHEVSMYFARDGWVLYSVAWETGPTYGETDELALSSTLRNYLAGNAAGHQEVSGREDFKCEPRGRKDVSINGYTGVEFDLTSCTIPTRLRMYTRVVGDQRQMYMGATASVKEDENVPRFLESFTVGPTQSIKSRRR